MTKTTDETHKRVFREIGDAIMGDRIYARCQKPGTWTLFRKSATHQGSKCILTKDAYARIERAFTNIQK
ncbi:MAG: hypothetical protein FJ134_15950 [Deltaproteobacteria bacterium]|nr:hypothetical protein [Deltaproteobacteria bacterium]